MTFGLAVLPRYSPDVSDDSDDSSSSEQLMWSGSDSESSTPSPVRKPVSIVRYRQPLCQAEDMCCCEGENNYCGVIPETAQLEKAKVIPVQLSETENQ